VSIINLIGLADNDPIPGTYIEVNFAQGEIGAFAGARRALLLGNKLASGTATADTEVYGPDTMVKMSKESEAIGLFGEGSELHRMYRMFTAINKTTPVYALAVAEDVTATAGTGTITIANTATGFGTLRIWMDDEYVDTGFATGDTPTDIADAAVLNINAKAHWGAGAGNLAGVITLTSKNKSARANLHKYAAQILESGTGVTATPLATTNFVNGTVADDVTDALASLTALGQRFDYLVVAQADQTNLAALSQFIDDQAAAVVGLRQRMVFGSTDTLAATIVITTALNTARAEVAWQAGGVVQPSILAAHNAAVFMLEEAATIPRLNFSGYGTDARTQPVWRLKPARVTDDLPTRTEIKSALNSGVTPIVNGSFGSTYLVKRITTRWLNGAVADYRVRDAHKVTVCDRYADDLIAKFSAQFTGKQIANDPKNEEPLPNANTVTPSIVGGSVNKLTLDYSEAGLVQNAATIVQDTIVIRETSPSTRMSVQVPLQPIDILDQLAVQVNQVA